MTLSYMLSILRIFRIPGLFPIMRDWQALVRMHFLLAAYESGLLKALTKPCEKEQLITDLHVKRPALLDALLDVGLATRELAIRDQRFVIKGKRSRALLRTDGDMLAAMIQANLTYYSDAYRHAATRLQGGELGDDLDKMGDLVARFSRIAEPILKDFLTTIVSGKNPMRILDVGCGSGVFLWSAQRANPNASGVGLDVDPLVVQQARNNLAAWGMEERFQIILGDVRHPPEEVVGLFDLIDLFNILYYFPRDDRAELLNNLRSLLAPRGVVAIAMNCHSRGMDVGAANLNLVNCSLKGLSPLPHLDEITSTLAHCGFSRIEVHRFMPGSTFYGIVAGNS